jgi:hypothetical protein
MIHKYYKKCIKGERGRITGWCSDIIPYLPDLIYKKYFRIRMLTVEVPTWIGLVSFKPISEGTP